MCCACSKAIRCRTRRGSVDPLRDFEDVETELILSDLVVVEKRMERVEKDRKKAKNPDLDKEFALLERLKAELEADRALRNLEFSDEDEKRIRGFQFLSLKPMLCVLNVGEADCRANARDRGAVSHWTAGGPKGHGGDGDLR